MRNKLFQKIIITMFFVLITVFMLNNFAYADNFNLDGYEVSADASIKTPFETVMGSIVAVMRIVCTGIAIIMLMVIGIKYLSAAPGERAELKKSAVQYVVGAIILFGSAGILTVLQSVTNNIVG